MGEVASCVSSSSVPECMCSTTTSICDPYNTDVTLFCDASGSPSFSFDCTLSEQTCVDGTCDIAATDPPVGDLCAGNAGKQVPIPPACTSHTLCDTEATTLFPPQECPAGQYFDFSAQNCLTSPPDPCANCDGSCSDPFDCSFYHSCVGGVSEVKNECTEEPNLFYDPVTNICVDDETLCDPITDCTFNEETTDGSTPATDTSLTPATDASSTPATDASSTPATDASSTPATDASLTPATDASSTQATDESSTPATDTSTPNTDSSTASSDTTTTTTMPAQCTAENVGENYPYAPDCKK